MKYSIIILNYNVKYFVDACLQSVQKAIAGKDAEIIVADNYSTDGSQAYLKGKYDAVKFLWFSENYGFAKAYNKAVAQAKGEYILILNPDTLVSENILDELQKFADQHSDFGILGGKMIDGTGHFLPESKRGIPTPLVAFSKLTKLYKLFPFIPFNQYYAGHLSEHQAGKAPVLTGAFMFMKRQTYQNVGGFDERYFMYGEDIDLSFTVLKSGKQNYYVPTAKIVHFKGESSQKDTFYYKHFLKTTFQFYRKHFRCFPPMEYMMKAFFKLWLFLRKKKAFSHEKINYSKVFFIGSKQHIETLDPYFKEIMFVEQLPEQLPEKSLVIFDTSKFSFSEIIDFMEKHKSYFRFYFPHKALLLGSDYKDSIGTASLFVN